MDMGTGNKDMESPAKMEISSAIAAAQGMRDNLICLVGKTGKALLNGQKEGSAP